MNIHISFNTPEWAIELIKNQEKMMATLEENTKIIADIAASVVSNTDLLASQEAVIDKIFAEVNKLVEAAGTTIPGLEELQAAIKSQSDVIAASIAKSTAVDGLIPDLPVVPVVPAV
jgi:uncharacterized protein involved in exopolysaccharide biosynthesis